MGLVRHVLAELALVAAESLCVLLATMLWLRVWNASASGPYFFSGLGAILIFSVLFAAGAVYFALLPLQRGISTAIASCSLCAAFFVLVPVTIERSVSVFLLNHMNDAAHPLSLQALDRAMEEEYLCKSNAMAKRMEEQRIVGNVQFSAEGFYLSDKGKFLISALNVTGAAFNVPEPSYAVCKKTGP